MSNDPASPSSQESQRFTADIEGRLGRRLTDGERRLALSLIGDKSAALVAREIEGAPITDPKKIRPEHKDTADESTTPGGDAR